MVRTKEEIKAELDGLRGQQQQIIERMRDVKQELADCIAEFQVGQRVVYGAAEFEICKVSMSAWRNSVEYRGRKVLKSGKLHMNSQELYGKIAAKEQS